MKIIKLSKKIIALIIVVVVIAGVVLIGAFNKPKATYDYITVEKKDLKQLVSVTGSVKAAEEVDLGLEKSGRVTKVLANVGDHVTQGETLVMIDTSQLSAQLHQAQAGVASAQAQLAQYQAALANQQSKLDELKQGSRPEDIAVSQSALDKAKQDLANDYADVRNVLVDAYNKSNDSVRVKTSGMFSGSTSIDYTLSFSSCASQPAIDASWKRGMSESELNQWQQELTGITSTSDEQKLDQAIVRAKAHLAVFDNFFDSVNETLTVSCALTNSALDTYRTNASTAKAAISTAIGTVNSAQQSISAQKLVVAKSSNELAVVLAGSSSQQISAQEAAVRQAEAYVTSQRAQVTSAQANVQSVEAQLSGNVIHAPFAGVVTKQEAKVGQIISPGSPIVSLMSDKQFQIETSIPESDIAKIKLTNAASLTLDAYGGDVNFGAKVVAIDPAETVIDGVSTYKVTLEFDQADERIRSGMTANLDIATDSRTQVLAIPQRAVISVDGEKYVRVLRGDVKSPIVEKTKVTTGMTASDGSIEITSGLSEGDHVDISTQ